MGDPCARNVAKRSAKCDSEMIKKSTAFLVCVTFLLFIVLGVHMIASVARGQDNEPTADFTASPTSGPANLAVAFTDNSTSYDGLASRFWDFGDGENSTEQNPTHVYNAGVYTVSLTVWDIDGDNDTETKINYITVTAPTLPPVANANGPYTGTEGVAITFDGSGSYHPDGIIISYFWDFGDGQNSTEQTSTHTYTQEGTYTVTLTVTDVDSATDTDTTAATVADTGPTANFSEMPTSGDEPLTVSFTDTSTSYDGIIGWTWNFGDGQSSEEQNPTHVYAADGTYTVVLMVLEEDGSDDVKTKMDYITVTDTAPTADFSYSQDPAPLTISFTDQSTSYDEIVSWFWNFGDGKTSTQQNPTHKFPRHPRVFNVTLTVTDADGSTDTITKQVSVMNSPPIADFDIVSSEKPTANEDISFIDQSLDPDGDIVSWFWDFGDGNTSTTQNVTHRYQALDTYVVSLTITDNDGATDTVSKNITIFDVTPPVTIDDYDGLWHNTDFTITLTATDDLSGVAETYYRINDGPTQNVGTHGQPLITTESTNNQLEYWSVDNAGNEETHQILTDVKLDKTNPTANAGPDQTVNEDTPMTFDGSASYDNIGINNYAWTFFDEAPQTLTGTNPTYTFNAPGLYTVTLTVTDAALNSATDTVVIIVIDVTKPIANAGDDQVVHEGTLVTFNGSASTDNVEVVNYLWTFVDVAPQTLLGVNATHIFDIPGVYNVTLIVSDGQGNLATDVVTITVIDATWPAANAGPDQVVDEDTLVNFVGSASTDNVGIISYVWTFMEGTLQTLFGVKPSYTFETPGIYTVKLNVTDAEGHFTTDTVVITVRDMTPPLIEIGNYATVVENAPVNLDASGSYDNVGIIDYQWDFGDGTFENSTIPSVIHTYAKPGVYTVTLAVMDGTGNVDATSISIVVHRDTDGDLLADYLDTDDDNDGMPDDWEILHGLDPLDPSDASLDPDGDDLSNLTEYQMDSDPNVYTSPSPFPLLIVLVVAIIGFVISLAVLVLRKL